MVPFLNFILTSSFSLSIVPLHCSGPCPYRLHSNNICSSVSTCPHPHRSSCYLHFIGPLPLTGRHPPLAISLILAPTLPSEKLSLLGHYFILTYSFHLHPKVYHSIPTRISQPIIVLFELVNLIWLTDASENGIVNLRMKVKRKKNL